MPVSRNAHHAQLAATPPSRTRLVTRFGVSVLKVVATIDTPMSHHGAARPEVKNSAVLDPARRASHSAGTNETAIETDDDDPVERGQLHWLHVHEIEFRIGAPAAAREVGHVHGAGASWSWTACPSSTTALSEAAS